MGRNGDQLVRRIVLSGAAAERVEELLVAPNGREATCSTLANTPPGRVGRTPRRRARAGARARGGGSRSSTPPRSNSPRSAGSGSSRSWRADLDAVGAREAGAGPVEHLVLEVDPDAGRARSRRRAPARACDRRRCRGRAHGRRAGQRPRTSPRSASARCGIESRLVRYAIACSALRHRLTLSRHDVTRPTDRRGTSPRSRRRTILLTALRYARADASTTSVATPRPVTLRPVGLDRDRDRAERVGPARDRRHLEVADRAEHAGGLGDRGDRGVDHAVAAAGRPRPCRRRRPSTTRASAGRRAAVHLELVRRCTGAPCRCRAPRRRSPRGRPR